MKARHLVMTAALIVSGWLALFDETADGETVEPTSRPRSSSADSHEKPSSFNVSPGEPSRQSDDVAIQELQARNVLIKKSKSEAAAAGLFGSHNWTPTPPVATLVPPPPPSAPPLPFKYLGKSKESDQWQVFLSKAEITLIVKESDVIDGLYRVQSITPPAMTLLYLPLSETQSLTIE